MTQLNKDRIYNILFIGNSYTFYNKMPEMLFAPIARSSGYSVNVSSITKGGRYLDADDTYSKMIDRALANNIYDYVVIQEQSVCPALTPERFLAAAHALAEKINNHGVKPVFFCTWGRKDDNETLAQYGWTHESMTEMLAASYKAAAEKDNALIAYVGRAFSDVYRSHGDTIEVYHTDSTHPSLIGSMLAALTIFATIFGADPTKLSCTGHLNEEDAAILKAAAKHAAQHE